MVAGTAKILHTLVAISRESLYLCTYEESRTYRTENEFLREKCAIWTPVRSEQIKRAEAARK